jgi:signal peptidase II
MESKKLKTSHLFIFAVLLIFIDQASKLAIRGFDLFGNHHAGMQPGDIIQVIGSFLQFTYVENEGMAFGISFGAGKILLSLFSVFAAIVLAYVIPRLSNSSNWIRAGFILIFAGAVGNLIDRVFYGICFGYAPVFFGRVVDFIEVDIPDVNIGSIHYTHWPVFNVADSCVSCGVVLLLLFHKHLPPMETLFSRKKMNGGEEQKEIS